ncbi:uncharacterized protein LOC119739872 [Patiria miniata]|uniref:Uncharacterized protein n=1 Tax=Patiria miniata TaxID=46514 RepID=A0A914B4P9_PATMI|nr:uncharacterized protein LOC119739872 [Patiria miniata]
MVKTLKKTSCDVPSTSLRLAPPQGRRLPVFHRQCANQLVHADCVLVLGEQRFQRVPCSHWEGTGASVPFSWINLEKRCTDNMRKHEIKQREYEQKLNRKYDLKLRAYEYNHRAYEFNLRSHIDDTEPRCSDYLVQRRRVSELKMRRINKMTKQRVSNQKALRSLKVSRQTCCSRSQVLESYVEYCQEAKKVSKPNRKKMRRSQRRQAYHRMRNDDNMYELTVQETCTDDVVRERSVNGMCRKDSNKDNQRKNNLCMCDVDVIEEKTTPLLETDYSNYLHSLYFSSPPIALL